MTSNLAGYKAEDKLPDGRTVFVRAIRPEDRLLLQEAFKRQSPHAIYLRFLRHKDKLTDEELAYFTEVDFVNHVALVVSMPNDGFDYPVAVGRYIVLPDAAVPPRAEVAISVDEAYQGLGIGTAVLKHLIQIAQMAGIIELTGIVLPENEQMLEIIDNSGLPITRTLNDAGVFEVKLRLKS